jgi:Uma2 family endonuclease
MATETSIGNAEYERLALSDDDRRWELWDGIPREKPGGTYAQNSIAAELGFLIFSQLDWKAYCGRSNNGRLFLSPATYLVPDFFVFPRSLVTERLRQDDVLEVYAQPVPLVAETWSQLYGDAYVAAKRAVYKQRGDAEIWLIHPYDRTLTAWRRRPDGGYEETVFTQGIVHPIALPSVAIDLALLFDF